MSLFLSFQDGFNNFKTFVEEELQTSMVRLDGFFADIGFPPAGNAWLEPWLQQHV